MTAARPRDTAVTFRPSAPVDAPAIHAVWVRAVRATHHFLSDTDFDDISAMVRDDYAPHADFLVAERAGVIVGFMGMTGRTIDSLFLDPDIFGQGLGRAFVTRAAQAGTPLAVDVNEQNTGARAFYERLGFTVVSRSDTDDRGRPYPILHLSRDA